MMHMLHIVHARVASAHTGWRTSQLSDRHGHANQSLQVRDGKNYVSESLAIENTEVEETGTLYQFASIQAARTAIGFTADGAMKIIQVDGQSWVAG